MIHNESKFSYNGKRERFAAFASDLREVSESFGIRIRGGRVLRFELSGSHSNCWEYRCTTGRFTAVIFND